MEAYGVTFSPLVTDSTEGVVECHSFGRMDRDGFIHETEDTFTPCVLHKDLKSTGTIKAPDQLQEPELSSPILSDRFDEVPCFSEQSPVGHHCEYPERRQSFPNMRALL